MISKDPETLVRESVQWLRCRAKRPGTKGFVVELTGGLDSAVTAALAKLAVGNAVTGLILSCRTAKAQLQDAWATARHMGIPHESLDLGPVWDTFTSVLPRASKAANEELKDHLRAAALLHFAAVRQCLVLGHGNRSDWEIGNFTKYGDFVGDVFPLFHLLRSQVHDIARLLRIPQRLVKKAPASPALPDLPRGSAGKVTYEMLDAFLEGDLLRVPLPVQDQIRKAQERTAGKRNLFQRFCPHAGPSEESVTEFEDHEAYDKSIEALTLISKAITSDHYLEDILRLIVMVTAEVMNSSVCSLWLLDEKEQVLRLRATQSIDSEYLKDRVLKVGEGIVGKVALEGRPYAVSNVLGDPIYKEKDLARRMKLVSMLSIPMRVKDRVIGVINCYTSHPHAFSDLQMNVLTTVANQAAVAIEKTELMVQTRVIQEELANRKITERAKDLLVKRLSISGEEAYRWLQKRSMNTRKSMREVSEAVLLTMEGLESQ
ncbi:MAG TPA: NAD(+) synthase [Syntrophobacteraceae bacterium]|nr:NAD(+) synthase [Syntrophobacteraceae bacterium]